jgi:hypothetical protein
LVQAAQIEAQGKLQADKYKTDKEQDFKRDQLVTNVVVKAVEQGASPEQALQWGQVLMQMISQPRVDAGTQMPGA